MKFKEISKEMTIEEIEIILKIVYPYSHLVKFNRAVKQNFIKVSFTLSGEEELYHADFLPDDIYVYDLKTVIHRTASRLKMEVYFSIITSLW